MKINKSEYIDYWSSLKQILLILVQVFEIITLQSININQYICNHYALVLRAL